MDGDEPSFVMLSYDNYQDITGEGTEVAVHKEENNPPFYSQPQAGLAAEYGVVEPSGLLINEIHENVETDEERINQLNQEIAMLKNEIKQKEAELFSGDID